MLRLEWLCSRVRPPILPRYSFTIFGLTILLHLCLAPSRFIWPLVISASCSMTDEDRALARAALQTLRSVPRVKAEEALLIADLTCALTDRSVASTSTRRGNFWIGCVPFIFTSACVYAGSESWYSLGHLTFSLFVLPSAPGLGEARRR